MREPGEAVTSLTLRAYRNGVTEQLRPLRVSNFTSRSALLVDPLAGLPSPIAHCACTEELLSESRRRLWLRRYTKSVSHGDPYSEKVKPESKASGMQFKTSPIKKVLSAALLQSRVSMTLCRRCKALTRVARLCQGKTPEVYFGGQKQVCARVRQTVCTPYTRMTLNDATPALPILVAEPLHKHS